MTDTPLITPTTKTVIVHKLPSGRCTLQCLRFNPNAQEGNQIVTRYNNNKALYRWKERHWMVDSYADAMRLAYFVVEISPNAIVLVDGQRIVPENPDRQTEETPLYSESAGGTAMKCTILHYAEVLEENAELVAFEKAPKRNWYDLLLRTQSHYGTGVRLSFASADEAVFIVGTVFAHHGANGEGVSSMMLTDVRIVLKWASHSSDTGRN